METNEYLRLKEIVTETFKMDFVSDDQRKAVFASLSDSGKVNTGKRSNKKRSDSGDDSGDKPYGFGNSINGAGWYHSDMTDRALEGILTSNTFQDGEIEAHKHFEKRIKKLGLKVVPIKKSQDVFGGGKIYFTNYTYEKK